MSVGRSGRLRRRLARGEVTADIGGEMETAEAAPDVLATPVDPEDERRDPPAGATGDELVESELLVEDVSIDGMCGVY
jgi:mycofactocin precursor